MNHEAIYRTHSNVVTIDENADGTVTPYDADGNIVVLDVEAVDAETITVVNESNLENMRRQRDAYLSETDYLALSDNTLTDEMRTYRQALRDLPANTTDPANPTWPTKPS